MKHWVHIVLRLDGLLKRDTETAARVVQMIGFLGSRLTLECVMMMLCEFAC